MTYSIKKYIIEDMAMYFDSTHLLDDVYIAQIHSV